MTPAVIAPSACSQPASARPLQPHHRIGIVGAGAAGLTCAEELRERGFRNITIFEAQGRAGGKIRSVSYSGAPPKGRGLFEAGTVFFVPSRLWSKLLRRHGIREEHQWMPRVKIADLSRGNAVTPLAYSHGYSALERGRQVALFLRLLEKHGPRHDRSPGVAPHVTVDVCEPTRTWFDAQGLSYVREVLLPIAGGAQFGPLVDDVPAVYVLRLLTFLRRYSLAQRLRLAMPQLRAGHEAVWTRIAATHDVRFGQPVTRVSTNGRVMVETPDSREELDALIVTSPLSSYLEASADSPDHERALLAQVRTLERVVITARVTGLGAEVFFAPRYASDGRVPAAHPYLFYEVDRGSGLFTFHPFLDGGRSPEDAEDAIREVVARVGGKVLSFEHRAVVRSWFPHFSGAALRGGAQHQLEKLQGQRGIWFAGELLAGIGVPHAMEYSAALVGRMTGLAGEGRV